MLVVVVIAFGCVFHSQPLFSAVGGGVWAENVCGCAIYASCHGTFPMPTISRPVPYTPYDELLFPLLFFHSQFVLFPSSCPSFSTTTGPARYPVGRKEYCRSRQYLCETRSNLAHLCYTIQVARNRYADRVSIFIDFTQAHLKFIVTELVTRAKGTTKVTNEHTNTDIFHQQSQQTQQIRLRACEKR